MTPILTFNIITIPDTEGLRTVYGTGAHANPEQLAEIAFQQGRQSHVHDHLPLHLHRIAAISCAVRDDEHFHIRSLGTPNETEAMLIRHLFDTVEKYKPQSVSWNGAGFDLPLLGYRALIHRLSAPRQWDVSKREQHVSLMNELSCHQPQAQAARYDIARLCGLPATPDIEPNQIWSDWHAGKLEQIRHRSEIDALNTYLIYLRFQQLRSSITPAQYETEYELVKNTLVQLDMPHWHEYLQAW